VIGLPLVKRQQTHQMQGVGVTAIERQGLLAADLRLQMPSGAQMARAGLTECRGIAGVGTLQSRLGFSGGYPAVATVHRHISMEAAHPPLDDSPWARNRFGYDAMAPVGAFSDLA
jgi:hypothetical protein